MQPFKPTAATVTIAVSSTSASEEVAPNGNSEVRLYNALNEAVFVAFGDENVTATTAGLPLAPGAVEVLRMGPGQTHVAGITASGSGSIYATPGEGI